jgi:hypothetical protein
MNALDTRDSPKKLAECLPPLVESYDHEIARGRVHRSDDVVVAGNVTDGYRRACHRETEATSLGL